MTLFVFVNIFFVKRVAKVIKKLEIPKYIRLCFQKAGLNNKYNGYPVWNRGIFMAQYPCHICHSWEVMLHLP
jgi:hypothetical protein